MSLIDREPKFHGHVGEPMDSADRTEIPHVGILVDDPILVRRDAQVESPSLANIDDQVSQSTLPPRITINAIMPESPRSRLDRRERRSGWKTKAVAATVGVLAVGAIFAYLSEGGPKYSSETQGKVFRITPEPVVVGGEVDSLIHASVHEQPQPSGIGKAILGIGESAAGPVGSHILKAAVNKVEGSAGTTGLFTGMNGEGYGVVETWIGAHAKGIEVKTTSAGGEEIDIPSKNIFLFSRPDLQNSMVSPDDGFIRSQATTNLKELPWTGSLKDGFRTDQGYVEGLAARDAVDYQDTSCVPAAWSEAQKALTVGYREVYEQEYKLLRQYDPNLRKYQPNQITVRIEGGEPKFKPEYSMPSGLEYQVSHQKACEVGKHALQIKVNEL